MQNPLTLYCPQAYPPPIPSHPMHALPLFYPSPCMSSPYSIPPMHTLPLFYPTHVHHPPILSHLMHALPLFHPSRLTSPYILSHLMHALPLFYPSPCTPSPYSIPAHIWRPCNLFYSSPCILLGACPSLTYSHLEGILIIFSFDIWFWVCHFWICLHWACHHLPSLIIWSINLSIYDTWMSVLFIHLNSPPHHIYIT